MFRKISNRLKFGATLRQLFFSSKLIKQNYSIIQNKSETKIKEKNQSFAKRCQIILICPGDH
ncbi:hypothetical protein BpHYR1_022995 [Brachionus plicatilis]|uniref:Uncharacterized protein n=1 Tax=Brachionus plicatilis TaxID=10195 RepID=A0A3M7QW98_BRAPC|nr:hypothetical protein BpHYR1_022995 [Brachionus plicatilis]